MASWQGANEAVDTLLRNLRGENITRMQFWSAKALLDLGQTVREDDTVSPMKHLNTRSSSDTVPAITMTA